MTEIPWGGASSAFVTDHAGRSPDIFFEGVTRRLQAMGAEHILITGLPLPGRDLGKLVLFQKWGDSELSGPQLAHVRGNDVLLRHIAVLGAPVKWSLDDESSAWLHDSSLMTLLKHGSHNPASYKSIVGIHVHHFDQMQIVICAASNHFRASDREFLDLKIQLHLETADLDALRPILGSRPGELSTRERLVLSLTAEGKTAGHIAEELQISQRTVHAHLQNASEKMQAANKTQTVVEAMRYGQIQLR